MEAKIDKLNDNNLPEILSTIDELDTLNADILTSPLSGLEAPTSEATNMSPPVVTGMPELTGDAVENDANDYAITGDIDFTDDVGDLTIVEVTALDGGIDFIGLLQAGASDQVTDDGVGTITWNFDITDAADIAQIEGLALNETIIQAYDITFGDVDGNNVSQTVTITITGTNDDPVITVGANDSAGEDLTETDGPLFALGTLSVEDIDVSDVVDAVVDSVTVTGDDNGIANSTFLEFFFLGNNAQFVNSRENFLPSGDQVIESGATTGTINWTFDSTALVGPQGLSAENDTPFGETFDHLAAGEVLTLTYTIRVEDINGGVDTQDVVITITGTNDGPVANDVVIPGALDEGDSFSETIGSEALPISLFVTDIDDDISIANSTFDSVTLNGNALAIADSGITYTPATGDFTFDSSVKAYDFLSDGEAATVVVTFTASDGELSDQGTITFTVIGTNDDPVITIDTDSGDTSGADLTETDAGLTAKWHNHSFRC